MIDNLFEGMTLDAWKGEALEAGIGYQIVGDEELETVSNNDYVEPLILEEQQGIDYDNKMDSWNDRLKGNIDITFQPFDPDSVATENGDTWINTLTNKVFIWHSMRGEWLPSDYKAEGAFDPSKIRDNELRCKDTYKILSRKIIADGMFFREEETEQKAQKEIDILDIFTVCETLEELNSVMSEINIYSDDCIENNRNYPFNKDGLARLRLAFLVKHDKILANMIDNSNMSSYFTRSGDNPVIHDQGTQWDMHFESEGGFSRLDPTSEEDFRQRNDLERDEILYDENGKIRFRDLEEQTKREVQAMIEERKLRFDRLKEYIFKVYAEYKEASLRNAKREILVKYQQSLNDCTNKKNFTRIALTRKQKNELIELCDILLKIHNPQTRFDALNEMKMANML
jgi:hypothetical protein